MTSDEQAFLNAIQVDPRDEAPRLIYADWLDEHERYDEAARQRQWGKAYRFLEPFVRGGEHDYDDDGNEMTPTKPVPFEEMMQCLNWWKESVQKHNEIGFGSNYAQDELQDDATRAEFWRSFSVITGVRPSQELADQQFYHCSC